MELELDVEMETFLNGELFHNEDSGSEDRAPRLRGCNGRFDRSRTSQIDPGHATYHGNHILDCTPVATETSYM
jgi:hypothetical protein